MTLNRTVNIDLEASVLYVIPDPLLWVYPVTGANGEVEDFEVGYANKASIEVIAHPKGNLVGLRLLRDGIPTVQGARGNFQHYYDVYQSGEVKEYTFTTHPGNRVFETIRQPHEGGVLSITRDRGAQREAERKEEALRRLFQSIVDSSPNGIVVFTALRDERGAVKDFIPLHANGKRDELLGLTPEEGSTLSLRSILEMLESEKAFGLYVEVVEKGESLQREQFVERTGRWLSISTVKLDDGFLTLLSDITEIKHSQQVLQQQSEYLNSILNASLSAVCTCEAVRDETGRVVDLRYTQINEEYERMVGLTKAEVIGKTMRELFPTAVDMGVFATHCQVLETGVPARFDLRYQGEGLDAWFDISSVKVGSNGVVITFEDIAEQKMAARKIEEQQQLLSQILSNSSNGISVSEFIRDEAGHVFDARTILANDAAIANAGIPKEVYLGKTLMEIEPSMLESPYFRKCLETLETGAHFITQYFFEAGGRWLELSVSRMDRNHLIHIFTDVTSIKEAQLKQDRLVEELRRSNESLEEFAHAASHDMKEPLRKIRTFSERLKERLAGRLDGGEADLVHRIESAAERMQLLVDDLLEFSHVSDRPRELESVNLNEKVKRALADLDLPIEEKGASVEAGPLPTVQGNKRQLQQLFHNLIGNALKYSKSDVPPCIRIHSRMVKASETPPDVRLPGEAGHQTFHLIEVSDNGIGFEPEYAERIFGMFQRLHGRGEYSGTGVGLSIARKVAENHRGYLWATGEPGVGATFHILLPAQ